MYAGCLPCSCLLLTRCFSRAQILIVMYLQNIQYCIRMHKFNFHFFVEKDNFVSTWLFEHVLTGNAKKYQGENMYAGCLPCSCLLLTRCFSRAQILIVMYLQNIQYCIRMHEFNFHFFVEKDNFVSTWLFEHVFSGQVSAVPFINRTTLFCI